MDQAPNKNDIAAIFKRLRAIPSNKVCFDCGAKIPTWASVTYGAFICIDCSAVHRSLGVHLTFVRSTQLDTNWTWMQLRNMQLGGNANGTAFFQQHGCTSTDAQQKYNSRAAQMYREKLHQLSTNAMRLHGNKLHLDLGHSEAPTNQESKEVDFFNEITKSASGNLQNEEMFQNGSTALFIPVVKNDQLLEGPNVNSSLSMSPTEACKVQEARKSTIGSRKPAATKKGLGARKGLGAQKVQTNFGEIEKEAQRADHLREQSHKMEKKPEISQEDQEKQIASVRLAYQDLSLKQKETEEKLRLSDPKKAEQMERLGMGFTGGGRNVRGGFSHSAASQMKTIAQDSPNQGSNSSAGDRRSKDFEEEFEFIGFTGRPPKFGDSPFMSRSEIGRDPWEDKTESKSLQSLSEMIKPTEKKEGHGRSRKGMSVSATSTPVTEEAQKKFGNAKSISSEQFFGNSKDFEHERRSNLAMFEGSSSISSADYFGDSSRSSHPSSGPNYNGPNLYDIKEGVKDGVNKVAGRISNLANGMINSLQRK